jgi:hypothetical protein
MCEVILKFDLVLEINSIDQIFFEVLESHFVRKGHILIDFRIHIELQFIFLFLLLLCLILPGGPDAEKLLLEVRFAFDHVAIIHRKI